MKYECQICEYKCRKQSKINIHIQTSSHLQNCENMKIELKNNKILYNKYITEFNINDEDNLPSIIREDIINRLSNINIENKINEEIKSTYKVPLVLIHELTQFTNGKTEQTLSKICQRYLLNSISTDAHIIQIIITNKSLLETKQWKVRTKNKMGQHENIDIAILSSDRKSEHKDIDKFTNKIIDAETREEWPNILIVCFHKKRIEDILKLFKRFCGRTPMIDNIKLKFHISFDEPDANNGLCSRLIKEYRKYSNILIGIEFITATPYTEFWKMLQKNNIFNLINPNSSNNIEHMDNCIQEYDEYLDNYYQIKEHKHLICNYATRNPLDYIEHVFENKDNDENPYIDMNDSIRKIIFSPAHLFTEKEGVGSHEEVVTFYNQKGFTVYLSNGKFKGFVNSDNKRITLEEFNIQHNITGELRDTLRKWAELNPYTNIAITGYWTIERGITFQTNGFNFTHAIISDYHTQLLNKLLQLIGRITGNKAYITNRCNIICPQHIIDKVNTLVTKTIELRQINAETYNATDFLDKPSCIPVKLTFLDDDFRMLVINSITNKRNYKPHLHSLLKDGYINGKLIIEDRNNIHVFTNDKKNNTKIFDDIHKTIKNVKMYKSGDKKESRRFKNFNDDFNIYKSTSQSSNVGEYNIDLAKDEYNHNGFINDVNTAWITFRHA